MKTGLFLAAALAQLAAAQPHRYRHQHLHEKRDVVTEIDYVTATTPDVVVYVDQNGNALSTDYLNAAIKQHASTSAAVEASTAAAYTVATASAVVTTPAVSVVPAATSTATADSNAGSASSSSSGYGLTYSPYNADGTCKSQSEVTADFEQLGDYSLIRLYGVDCNQLNIVGSAAIAKGMKLFVGVYDISDVAAEVAEIVAYASGNWAHISTISIGNEMINSGRASVSTVVAAVNTARTLLRAAGYTGNVVTVDTWNAVLNNPELCECSDFAAINAHAFFNPTVEASGAGKWVADTAAAVKAKCGKTTVVTESGWPSQGYANGVAVPGEANQVAAVSSLKSSMDSDSLVLFTAYNDFWKTNFDGSFGAEQYWGIFGTSSQ